MIAPFWADVDTRGPLSGLVYYKVTPSSLIVIWDHVGYFASQDNLLNTFQLIITDGTDPIVPNGNTAFCYGEMQFTTGSASGGADQTRRGAQDLPDLFRQKQRHSQDRGKIQSLLSRRRREEIGRAHV